MKVKNTTRASHSRYYYYFYQIHVVLFINSSRPVVFPILIPHLQKILVSDWLLRSVLFFNTREILKLIALSSGNFPLNISRSHCFCGLYPGTYIPGAYIRGLNPGNLYPGGLYAWLKSGAYIPGAYIRGAYIRGGFYPQDYIWGPISDSPGAYIRGHSWYYYHFHQICEVLFINSSRTVVLSMLITYMKKLLVYDWLRAVQLKSNTSAKSVIQVQKA